MIISVLTPYFGNLDFEHLQCIRKLASFDSAPDELKIHQWSNCPWVDMVFAALTEMALKEDADIMFFLEHDMLFEAKDVVEMSRRLHASEDYDVLAGAYSQRRPGGRIVAGLEESPAEFYKPGVYKGSSCGFGFTAIKRHVFEEMAEDMPHVYCPAVDMKVHPFFAHEISNGYYGQDTSFSRRLVKYGFKIGIDAQPRLYHRGNYNYALEDTGITVPRYETLLVNQETTPGFK